MEEIIEVRFANSESDFIYSAGVNKGYTKSHAKIDRCYFMSNSAKSLYRNLSHYLYEGKRECYPGRETLKQELGGWGNSKFDSALKELKEVHLITVEKKNGKNTSYVFQELQRCSVIAHSEYIHSLRLDYREKGKQERFYKALTAYRNSELYLEVVKLANPFELRQQIAEWFSIEIEGNESPSINEEETQPVEEMVIKEEKKTTNPLPTIINIIEGVERIASVDEKKTKPKKDKNFNNVPVSEWNTHHFIGYFDHIFLSKRKLPYPPGNGDLGAIKHLITQTGDCEKVKQLMDKYFELYDEWSIHNFSSIFVQQYLINHLNSNPSTSYKKKTGKSTDIPVDDAWRKGLEGWGED